jgi:hypothetical protein
LALTLSTAVFLVEKGEAVHTVAGAEYGRQSAGIPRTGEIKNPRPAKPCPNHFSPDTNT